MTTIIKVFVQKPGQKKEHFLMAVPTLNELDTHALCGENKYLRGTVIERDASNGRIVTKLTWKRGQGAMKKVRP